MPDDGSFASVSIVHNDYKENSTLYRNHTTYDCLKAYITPYTWRPSRLIMVSSNTSSSQQLNSSALLAWGIIEQGAHDAEQPLCLATPGMRKKCNSLGRMKPEDTGDFVYMDEDLVINYCLFKATDGIETRAHTCHLQSSPRILIGITLFLAKTLRNIL